MAYTTDKEINPYGQIVSIGERKLKPINSFHREIMFKFYISILGNEGRSAFYVVENFISSKYSNNDTLDYLWILPQNPFEK